MNFKVGSLICMWVVMNGEINQVGIFVIILESEIIQSYMFTWIFVCVICMKKIKCFLWKCLWWVTFDFDYFMYDCMTQNLKLSHFFKKNCSHFINLYSFRFQL